MREALEKLCKWRGVFAAWHLGSRTKDVESGVRAMRDQIDKWLVLRAEGSALVRLLVDRGVFTEEEWLAQVEREAELLDEALGQFFPGFKTQQSGFVIYDTKLAQETMRRLGFPP